MSRAKRLLATTTGVLGGTTVLSRVFAEPLDSIVSTGINGCADFDNVRNMTSDCVGWFIVHLIGVAFAISGAVTLLMIIIAGYQIATAKIFGQDRSEGFSRLRAALIGFSICALGWVIVDLFVSFLS